MSNGMVLRETPREGVAVITLNRSEKRNALNIPMLEQLHEHLEAANDEEGVRAIVLRGNGPVFCAGLDMKEATDMAKSHRSAELVAQVLTAIYYSPKVTFAAIHGAAVAGGAGIMAACDIAVADKDSKFGFPEVHRGLVAGLVMTFIRRLVPERRARELLLLGEIIEADRAAEMGLVTRAVPTDMLDETLELLLDQVLKAAPGAIRRTKSFFEGLHHRPVKEDLQRALDVHITVRNSEEAQEGMHAFLEKRDPSWVK